MQELSCVRARQCLRTILWTDPATQLPPELREHLSHCAVCRTTLLLIDALKLTTVPAPIECAQCQEDLPAFVERERAEGPAGAIRAYPSLWWHLWTCQTCLDTYDLAKARPGASRAPATPPKLVRLLRLARAFLNRAIPAPAPVVAVARGAETGPSIIAEGIAEDSMQFALSVAPQPNQSWTVVVTVTPAPAGNLLLTLGTGTYRAPFAPDGSATVENVPAALLSDRAGPDMLVEIEVSDAS